MHRSPKSSGCAKATGSKMISRGQIYFVNLDPTRGREQAGRRPVLVVSADAINRQPLIVTVVVGTKSSNVPRDYPTNVRVSAKETGLPYDTLFLCFQLRSLDPSRFLEPPGHPPNLAGIMPPARMREVEEALRLCLGLILEPCL
jgi:mRNA interferase MazF